MFRGDKTKRWIASLLLAVFLAPVVLGALAFALLLGIRLLYPEFFNPIHVAFFTYPREIGEMKLPRGTKVRFEYPKGKEDELIFQPQRITIDLPEGEDIVYELEGKAWRRLSSGAEGRPVDLPPLGKVEMRDAKEFLRYVREFGSPVPLNAEGPPECRSSPGDASHRPRSPRAR